MPCLLTLLTQGNRTQRNSCLFMFFWFFTMQKCMVNCFSIIIVQTAEWLNNQNRSLSLCSLSPPSPPFYPSILTPYYCFFLLVLPQLLPSSIPWFPVVWIHSHQLFSWCCDQLHSKSGVFGIDTRSVGLHLCFFFLLARGNFMVWSCGHLQCTLSSLTRRFSLPYRSMA